MYTIISIPAESNIPQVKYLNRFPSFRRGQSQAPGDVSYMCGWMSGITYGANFYAAPVVFQRHRDETKIKLDVVPNQVVMDYPIIGDFYEQELSQTFNRKALKQADTIPRP